MLNSFEMSLAVLCALAPRSTGERVRCWVVGGWTAWQVLERLEPDEVADWLAAEEGELIVNQRRLATAVHTTLVELAAAGRVRRRASRYGVELRSKGHRHAVVDVFRLA